MKRFPSKANALAQLRRSGLQVATVIDVGIRKDTPELRQAFPDCRHVLFEPIVEHFEAIRDNYRNMDYSLENIALSDHDGELELRLLHRTGSEEITHVAAVQKKAADTRTVTAMTLDSYISQHPQAAPYLVKLDVDGHETAILHGSVSTLKETACVIVEATMRKIPERVALLAASGFRIWDIVDFAYRNGALWQVDLIFLAEREIAANPAFASTLIQGETVQATSWFSLTAEFQKTIRAWEP